MIDPIYQKKIFPQAKEREIHIQEKELPKPRKFPWSRIIWTIIIMIILSVCFFGGLFIYELSKASDESITENFSGGAPVLNNEEYSLPEVEESNSNYDLVNILLLGNGGVGHAGGGLTDVIQVLSINVKSKKALMVSIPRDLYVQSGTRGKHKINAVYVYGEMEGKGRGGDIAKKVTSEVVGLPIHYYLKVDFEGFKEIVDILGGIDIYVDKGINDPVWGYKISQGMHHFNGTQALDYVRSRKSTSDFDRSLRQQKTLIAMRDKSLSLNILSNPQKIKEIIEAVSSNLRTDITLQELIKIFQLTKDIPRENLTSYVIDNGEDGLLYSTMSGGAYILLPNGGNYDKIHELIKQKLP